MRERDLELGSKRSGLGLLGWTSWVNTGWLDTWVGVVGGVESPEAVKTLKKKEQVQHRYLNLSLVSLNVNPYCVGRCSAD